MGRACPYSSGSGQGGALHHRNAGQRGRGGALPLNERRAIDREIIESQPWRAVKPILAPEQRILLTTNDSLGGFPIDLGSITEDFDTQQYYSRPDVIELYRNQRHIATPLVIRLKDDPSYCPPPEPGPEERLRLKEAARDERYMEMHSKLEGYEQAQDREQLRETRQTRNKLKKRIEDLQEMDDAEFFSMPAAFFPPAPRDMSDPHATQLEGRRRKDAILNAGSTLLASYASFLSFHDELQSPKQTKRQKATTSRFRQGRMIEFNKVNPGKSEKAVASHPGRMFKFELEKTVTASAKSSLVSVQGEGSDTTDGSTLISQGGGCSSTVLINIGLSETPKDPSSSSDWIRENLPEPPTEATTSDSGNNPGTTVLSPLLDRPPPLAPQTPTPWPSTDAPSPNGIAGGLAKVSEFATLEALMPPIPPTRPFFINGFPFALVDPPPQTFRLVQQPEAPMGALPIATASSLSSMPPIPSSPLPPPRAVSYSEVTRVSARVSENQLSKTSFFVPPTNQFPIVKHPLPPTKPVFTGRHGVFRLVSPPNAPCINKPRLPGP